MKTLGNKKIFNIIEELEVKDKFEKINSSIDYSKYTTQVENNKFKLILFPLIMLVTLVIIVPLFNVFNTSEKEQNNLPDDSLLETEISNEETEMLLSILFDVKSEIEVIDPRSFSDLIRSCYNEDLTRNDFIVELTSIGYGDYICGYFSNETIDKIENNKKGYSMLEYTYLYGIDSMLSFFQNIKAQDRFRDEPVFKECDKLYFYRQEENEVLYRTKSKRLVGVWRELVLESSDGRQLKIWLNVKGVFIENNFTVTETINIENNNGQYINKGDKFLATESILNTTYLNAGLIWYSLLGIQEKNGIECIYQIGYTIRQPNTSDNYLQKQLEFNVEFVRFLDYNAISKEYIGCYNYTIESIKYEVDAWSYWLDYSKVREKLGVK